MFENTLYKKIGVILIVLVSLLLTINNFVDLGFGKKVSLGLDLKGGSHLLLQVDFEHYLEEQMSNSVVSLKDTFLKNKVKALPKLENNKISIIYRRDSDLKFIENWLDKNTYTIENAGDNKLVVSFSENYLRQMKSKVNKESVETIRKRIDEFGTKDSLIQVEGEDKILVQVAGLSDSTALKELLGRTAKLTFHIVNENPNTTEDVMLLKSIDDLYELELNKTALLGGDSLIDATVIYDNAKPVISFKLNEYGARRFAEITENNIGKMLAIVLDDKIVTAPRINTKIEGGSGVISGNFSFDEATDIVLLLRSGSLIAPLNIIEEKTVGATLGQDLIKQGTIACIVGFILTMLFVFIFYRKFGIYSNIVSIINMLVLMAMLSLLNVTLTLPGIAGIVLTIGMSVDSNILIFERIKEEYFADMAANSLATINKAFKNILATILDANLTTAIVAVILYIFGTGAVKGFGIILLLGIISSVFSSLVGLKMILDFVYKNKKLQL